MVWDLAGWGCDRDGLEPCRIWELVPVKVENFAAQPSSSSMHRMDSDPIPPYEEKPGNYSCTCSHLNTEPSDDGFGTTVIEVTTVTTRKKYRRDD